MGKVTHIDMAHAIRASAANHKRRKATKSRENISLLFLLIPLVFAVIWMLPDSWFSKPAPIALYAAAGDAEQARFGYCDMGGGSNCVIDGDTFRYQGQKIRIADIDTPETHPPRCAYEAQLGSAATARLHGLLNAGPFALEQIDRDTDRYGRQLRIVKRGGTSIGAVLVNEGLARWYADGRQPWC
jgi:micrococcal nuclease